MNVHELMRLRAKFQSAAESFRRAFAELEEQRVKFREAESHVSLLCHRAAEAQREYFAAIEQFEDDDAT